MKVTAAEAKAEQLLAEIDDPLTLGMSMLIDEFIVETNTIGCRNHADDPEEEWWERHWQIFDDSSSDGISVVLGDPADGKFATITPIRTEKQGR